VTCLSCSDSSLSEAFIHASSQAKHPIDPALADDLELIRTVRSIEKFTKEAHAIESTAVKLNEIGEQLDDLFARYRLSSFAKKNLRDD
jgi:hypothetical protein